MLSRIYALGDRALLQVLVAMLLPMPAGLHRVYHLITTAIHEGVQHCTFALVLVTYMHMHSKDVHAHA